MGVYANFSDVQLAFEEDIPAERAGWVNALIDRAERLLNGKVSGVQTRIDAGSVDPLRVMDAIVTTVCRIVRNPEGLLIETEGNYSRQADRAVSSGRMFFDPEDLAALRPVKSFGSTLPIMSRVPDSRWQP